MQHTRASALAALSLVLVSPTLASCGLLGGDDHLDDALAVVPAGVRSVTFSDHEAALDAAGLDDLETGTATEADLDRYFEATETTPGLETDLTAYLELMQDAPFSDLDVVWAAGGFGAERGFAAYRLDDDVDLDAVGDELAAGGLAEDEVAGRRHFRFDPSTAGDDPYENGIAGHYPLEFVDVTIDPDEHLLVVGDGAAVLAVVDGDDALADSDALDDLLDGSEGVTALQANLDVDCVVPASRIPPEAVAARDEQLSGLGRPGSWAYIASGDDEVVRLAFADDAAAESDAAARSSYLSDGTLVTGQPVGDLGTFDVDRDGSVVEVGLDLDPRAVDLVFLDEQDGPVACVA